MGSLEYWGPRFCNDDKSGALELGFPDVDGRRGRLAIPDVKWCERRQACWKLWDG